MSEGTDHRWDPTYSRTLEVAENIRELGGLWQLQMINTTSDRKKGNKRLQAQGEEKKKLAILSVKKFYTDLEKSVPPKTISEAQRKSSLTDR